MVYSYLFTVHSYTLLYVTVFLWISSTVIMKLFLNFAQRLIRNNIT